MGEVYKITEGLFGKGRNVNAHVKDKQGALLTLEKEQKERWTKHFKEVLNRPDSETTVDILEAMEDIDICTELPSKEEAIKAERTTGHQGMNDQLTAELFNSDPVTATEILLPLLKIWE